MFCLYLLCRISPSSLSCIYRATNSPYNVQFDSSWTLLRTISDVVDDNMHVIIWVHGGVPILFPEGWQLCMIIIYSPAQVFKGVKTKVKFQLLLQLSKIAWKWLLSLVLTHIFINCCRHCQLTSYFWQNMLHLIQFSSYASSMSPILRQYTNLLIVCYHMSSISTIVYVILCFPDWK